jgi:hypothetical protein
MSIACAVSGRFRYGLHRTLLDDEVICRPCNLNPALKIQTRAPLLLAPIFPERHVPVYMPKILMHGPLHYAHDINYRLVKHSCLPLPAWPRPCLVTKFFLEKHCSTLCLYLTNIVRSWISYAKKIRLDIYRQTVQLVIFLSTFNASYIYRHMWRRILKFFVFWSELNNAQAIKASRHCCQSISYDYLALYHTPWCMAVWAWLLLAAIATRITCEQHASVKRPV